MYNEGKTIHDGRAGGTNNEKGHRARHTQRDPVKRTLYYAVHTSRAKKERERIV